MNIIQQQEFLELVESDVDCVDLEQSNSQTNVSELAVRACMNIGILGVTSSSRCVV